jgi:hypothetical protein
MPIVWLDADATVEQQPSLFATIDAIFPLINGMAISSAPDPSISERHEGTYWAMLITRRGINFGSGRRIDSVRSLGASHEQKTEPE